jgi:anaerobic ribonucleoside-triphosphate reductase activating protein
MCSSPGQVASLTSEPAPPLRVARILAGTNAEGPGRRFAIWVQGCTIRCAGCFNPQMWSARGGLDIDSETLLSYIMRSQVEGVTFLGGEPFEQAAAAAELAEVARASGLSVMTFTGFTLEHLSQTRDVAANRLLDATDLLVDGPYDASRPDLIRPWVRSNNQRFHFLTQRYAYLRDSLHTLPDRIEVRVSRGGEIAVNGWAEVDALETLLDGVGSRHDTSTTEPFHDHGSRQRGLHGEAKR